MVQPTGDKRGHYGTYTTHLCQEMAKLGHEVTLVTNQIAAEHYLNGQAPLFKTFIVGSGKLDFSKYDEALMAKRQLNYFYGYFKNSYKVVSEALRLSKSGHADAVLIMDSEFLMASIALMRHGRRLPPVVMYISAANFSYDTYVGSKPMRLYKVFQKNIFKRTLGNQIKAITVLGEWHVPRLRAQLGLGEDFQIDIVTDGGGDPRATLEKFEARKKIGVSHQGLLLLFFGNIRKDKGIENMLDALQKLNDVDFHLVLAGFPADYSREQIESMVKKRGLDKRITLKLEYVSEEDIPHYFSAADVSVMAYSKMYTGGSGPLSKQVGTYSKPVIASNVSEMGRLVSAYDFGLLSNSDDPSSLAEKIRLFAGSSSVQREQWGKNSYAFAMSQSWPSIAKSYVEVFERVLASQKSANK